MTEEIRRRKTADPEMDAMTVLTAALAPLDIDTCARVLRWATDRFLEQPKRETSDLAWAGVAAQIDAYKKAAQQLGVDDRTLAHTLAGVRQAKGLAPIDRDPDPTTTLATAVDEATP